MSATVIRNPARKSGLRETPEGFQETLAWSVLNATTDKEAIDAVKTAEGLAINVHHPDLTSIDNLLCKSLYVASMEEGGSVRYVHADFGQPTNGAYQISGSGSLLDLPPVIDWSFEQIEELCDTTDEAGNEIINSAGDPITGYTRVRAITVMTIERWKASYDPKEAAEFVNAMNDDEPTLPNLGKVGKGTLLCRSYAPASRQDGLTRVPITGTTGGTGWAVGMTVTASAGGGTGVIFEYTSSLLTLTNASGTFNNASTVSGTGGVSATVTAATPAKAVLVRWVIAYDPLTHLVKVPDVGYQAWYSRPGSSTKVKGPISSKGELVSQPVLLLNGYPQETGTYSIRDPKGRGAWQDNNKVTGTDVTGASRYTVGTYLQKITFERAKRKHFVGLV